MDSATSNALRRKAELLKELEEIDLFLKLHNKFAGKTNEERVLAPSKVMHAGVAIGAVVTASASGRVSRKRGRPSDFADIMEIIIREVGRPLNRPELADQIEFRGIEIPSDDKPRYLGTILWRHNDRFRNLPNFGYWLADEPYPPANYDPKTDTPLRRALDKEADAKGFTPTEEEPE